MTSYAIIGGHGKVAQELSRLLTQRGDQVTSVIRSAEQCDAIARTGATPVVLDVEHATVDQVADLLTGHDAVVWSAGAGGGSADRTYAVDRDAAIASMDAADRAGVPRYVMVSYLGAGVDHGVPRDSDFYAYAEAKAAADAHLRTSRLDWTILGPGALTDDAGSGSIDLNPQDGSSASATSRENVARVAAAVLERSQTVRHTVEFRDGATPIADALAHLGP